MMKLNHT